MPTPAEYLAALREVLCALEHTTRQLALYSSGPDSASMDLIRDNDRLIVKTRLLLGVETDAQSVIPSKSAP